MRIIGNKFRRLVDPRERYEEEKNSCFRIEMLLNGTQRSVIDTPTEGGALKSRLKRSKQPRGTQIDNLGPNRTKTLLIRALVFWTNGRVALRLDQCLRGRDEPPSRATQISLGSSDVITR